MPFPRSDARIIAADNCRRVKYKRRPVRREVPLTTLGSFDLCWCGSPKNHDWEGQEEGTPHPR